ncbi:hypothetical protein IVB27_08895 [Bradyrhizobium sp. 197]|nr:hypothetical protein [Bradyrhizobium sp. 197]MCK1474921.1 hypothetical protein [Bradyrhizobium sp. 197]
MLKLVADLSLDKQMLQHVIAEMYGLSRLRKALERSRLRNCIGPLAS